MVDTSKIPQTSRVLRVRLQTHDKTILLYSASDIEVLTPGQFITYPFLQRVGPDILDLYLTPNEVRTRLLSPRFRSHQFSDLLLDQAFLAGLSNYLRVEILWQVGLTGQHKAPRLSGERLDQLANALLDIPRLPYTTHSLVSENKYHGALFRFRVFHRDGETCECCGRIIERTILFSRPFYWCPGCRH